MSVYAATKNAVRAISEELGRRPGTACGSPSSPGSVRTDFADSMLPALREQIVEQMDQIGLPPDAVARAIAFAVKQPEGVDVGDIVVRPTAQA
ncbi:NADP-dependent 3-hydroxy acid dehydrogenase YdfG OS=Streptomyces albaduncus OX=68172 GN=FHS32_005528 PE=3 SV=1 [Streptomyces griseoloalbus]